MQPDQAEPKLRGKTALLFKALSDRTDKFVTHQVLLQAIGENPSHQVARDICNLRRALAPFGYRIEVRKSFGYLLTKAAA